MKLFYKLLVLLIGIGIMPLLPGGALMFYYQHRAETNALKLHTGLARTTAISVKQYIAGLGGRMAFTQELERALAVGDTAAAHWSLDLATASNQDFLLLAVLDENGRELMRSGKPDMVRSYKPLNAAKSPLFQRSSQHQQVVLGGFDTYGGGPGGMMFFPLATGHTLFVNISFNTLWSQIYSQRFGNTGCILLSSDDGVVFKTGHDVFPRVDPVFLKNQYRKGMSGTLTSIPTPQGTYVGAFEYVQGTNMTVLTLQSKREAFWDITLTMWLTLFFLLTILTFAYFTALALAERISGPVDQLKNAADRITRHDFKKPVVTTAMWGEFVDLANTFNLMQSELDHYHSIQLDKLFDEKRKLDLLISLMRDGILLTDPQYRVLYLNDAAKMVLDSGLFNSLFAGKPALGRREKNALIARELVTRHAGHEAFAVPRQGGGTGYYRVTSELFRANASGEAVRLIVVRDITVEREIDAMKEDFFNAIAHDLRAPLIGLQGYIKLLETAAASETERQEYLDAMAGSVKRLFEMVEGVLDIARMETGTIKLNPADFDFEECANRIMDGLRPLLEDKHIAAAVQCEPGSAAVYGDERLVGRILNNLLSNSIKFTPEGGSITVDCHATANGGRLLRVTDTGAGIASSDIELVFEKYRQTSAGKSAGGYGLGLAIVKTIAALHGGTARALSGGLGKGTTIEITLPPKPLPGAKPAQPPTNTAPPAPRRKNRRYRGRRHKHYNPQKPARTN